MDDLDFQALTEKLGNVILQNKQLRRANLNLKKKNKHLGRVIKKMNENAAKDRKPHYRNGQKRSSYGRLG